MRKIKIISVLGFILLGWAGSLWSQSICMIIAFQGFRDEELLVPKGIFESRGYNVEVFSSRKGQAQGMVGTKIKVDKTLEDIDVDKFQAVIFVGGIGAKEYWDSPQAHKIARETLSKGKILGAICIAPVILANAGVLSSKKATCWSSEGGRLVEKGAEFTGMPVEVDGNIITASGPDFAEDFALKILEALRR